MKREIEFKAKNYDDEWCYGHLVYTLDGHYCITQDMEEEEFDICSSSFDGYSIVDEDTICLFTGLKDKDGQGIYEGDILRGDIYPLRDGNKDNYYVEVCWWDDEPGFGLRMHKNPKSDVKGISDGDTETIGIIYNYEEHFEVVGNVYDNPELIKKEE